VGVGGQAMTDNHYSTFKRLSRTDFHTERDFDGKSSSSQSGVKDRVLP